MDAMLRPQDWSFPVPILYGPGRLAELGARLTAMGIARPLIVTDRGSRDLPFVEALRGVLGEAGLDAGLYAGFSPNPRDDEVAQGVALFAEGRYDALIGIGGGSAMDGAKAICLSAQGGVDLWAFEFESAVPEVAAPFPTLITVPTTAGTGAETESTAMITHVQKGMKFCVWHPELKPALALLDPALTVGLPATLTAWTGADAMTHAIEAYLVPGFHPLCDGLALEGLALVAKWLPVAVAGPDNVAARGGMLVGSCLAGIAFTKGLGLVHAISHMVGAEFDTQHGLTNAVILPVVLRYNLAGGREAEKVARMAEAMGVDARDADGFVAEVCALLDRIGIPRSLSDIGVPEDCAPRIAAKAVQDSAAGTNPREAGVPEVEALVREAIRGAR